MARCPFKQRTTGRGNRCIAGANCSHEYISPFRSTGELPSPSELVAMFDSNPADHQAIWTRAAKNPLPIVVLGMQNIATRVSRKVLVLVDTGADVTTLTQGAADDLGIDRYIRPGDAPVVLVDAAGTPMIGLRRWVWVYLDSSPHMVPVIVPPVQGQLEPPGARAVPLGAGPRFNVLGRARLLENFRLCFGAEKMYACQTASRKA